MGRKCFLPLLNHIMKFQVSEPNARAQSMYAGPLLSKCIGDANANAMDKALDALCAWLKKADESQASR